MSEMLLSICLLLLAACVVVGGIIGAAVAIFAIICSRLPECQIFSGIRVVAFRAMMTVGCYSGIFCIGLGGVGLVARYCILLIISSTFYRLLYSILTSETTIF